MNDKKKLRQLNVLLYNVWYPPFDSFNNHKTYIMSMVNEDKNIHKHFTDKINLYRLAEELNISDDDLKKMWQNMNRIKLQNHNIMNQRPQKEGRDNKGIYVGSGGSNRNSVRYPSKKRSLRTWKIFYEMFPHLAEKDKWDGKTSKKMK